MISVGSLVGIFVAPFSDEKGFSMVLTFLVAIAVSTLLGDAVLHLFPHVSIFHSLLIDVRAFLCDRYLISLRSRSFQKSRTLSSKVLKVVKDPKNLDILEKYQHILS